MSRRNGLGLKVILTVACGGLILYGFYTFHDLHTRLKRSEEKGDHLHQQHDSLSAQLQVVYEHKGRLEKSLQKEKGEHKKTKEELTNDRDESEKRFVNEKKELLMRINSINQEHKLLKNQNDDLQVEFARVQHEQGKELEDHKKIDAQRNEEYQSMKQDKDNEIAQLKDNVADLMRRNTELQHKLETSLTNNARNQRHRSGNVQQNLAPDLNLPQDHRANQQMQHPDAQQMAGQHPQDNQAGVNQGFQGVRLGGNQIPDVKNLLPEFQNIQKRFQKQQSNVIAAMAGNEAQNQDQVNYQNQKMKEHVREKYPEQRDLAQHAHESDVQQMQINKPLDPMAYVQPKEPKADHGHLAEHDGHGEVQDQGHDDQEIVHQVRPPNINADENDNEHNDPNNAREEMKENEELAAGLGADQDEQNSRKMAGLHQPDRDQNVNQVVAPRAEDLQKPAQVNEQIVQPRLQEEINLNRDEGQVQGLGHRGRGDNRIRGPEGGEPHNQVARPFENEMGKKDSQLLQDGQHDIDNDNKDKEEEEDDQFEEDQEDDNDAHNNQANDAA